MDEIKEMLKSLISIAMTNNNVENDKRKSAESVSNADSFNTDEARKGEDMVNNEKTDKRKLIDEIGGILKGKVDEELSNYILFSLDIVPCLAYIKYTDKVATWPSGKAEACKAFIPQFESGCRLFKIKKSSLRGLFYCI